VFKSIDFVPHRSFPEIVYYRDPIVQAQLTNILFLYSTTNVAIGYRQGMHEILAPLYFAVDWDSINDDVSMPLEDAELQEVCSRTWVAADAWSLFVAVMRGVGQWYEWRETPALSNPITSPLLGHVQLNVPQNHLDTEPYVTPIVKACNRIQSKLLKSVDPLLWKSMHSAGIEPQIYGMYDFGIDVPLSRPLTQDHT
jgi:TBC1 domain family member 5